MSRRQLTTKQNAFLEFLQGHLATHRVWPTYREIVDHFEYRSPNSVTQNLQALSRKGFLERDQNGYRLLDRSGRDGTIAVRGTIRAGGVEPAAERLSLAALFHDLDGLHALRLDADVDGGGRCQDAKDRHQDQEREKAREGHVVEPRILAGDGADAFGHQHGAQRQAAGERRERGDPPPCCSDGRGENGASI